MSKIELKTSNGVVFDAVWLLLTADDTIFAKIVDDRPVSTIAADLDGLEWIQRTVGKDDTVRFVGFSVLYGIERESKQMVRVTIKKAV